MKTVSRGILAGSGFVTGWLTLVFLFQFNRYLGPALAGDQLSLGMAAIFAVMTYAGAVITVLAFKPSVSVAKYLSGVGGVVTAGFVLSALYLLTTDLASGIMLVIVTMGQVLAVGIVYAGAVIRSDSSDSESESDTTPATDPSETQEPQSEPGPEPESTPVEPDSIDVHTKSTATPESHNTTSSESGTGRDIDWRSGGQIFAGIAIFLIGIPITIQSPVGVPILLIGLALIPRVRSWSMEILGRSSTES